MFFLKKRDKNEEAITNISQDLGYVREWLYYLYRYNQHLLQFIRDQDARMLKQEDELDELKLELKSLPKSPEDFKKMVDSFYSFEGVLDRLRSFEKRLETVENKPFKHYDMQKPKSELSNVKERVLKKIARSSKDYVKNLVLNLVGKYGKVSALQLREIIVEEQGLCSKSSFYRILEELENEDALNIVSKGKIKVYVDVPIKNSHPSFQ